MSLYSDLLADPCAVIQLLVVVQALNPQTGNIEVFYECEGALGAPGFVTEPTDSLPNQIFEPRVITSQSIDASIGFKDEFGGRSFPAYGEVVLNNADGATATLASLSVSNGIATATTANPHSWISGDAVTIRGAAPAAFDVTSMPVTVTGPKTLTFPLALSNQSATGSSITAYSGLDGWRTLSFDAQPLTIYAVGTISDGRTVRWPDRGTPFAGTVEAVLVDEQKVVIQARDIQKYLDRDVQPNLYRGTSHCLRFDGATQSCSLTSFASLADKTFELWIRCTGPNAGATPQVVAHQGSSFAVSALDWDLQVDASGNLRAEFYNGAATDLVIATSGRDYRDGAWHHVALTVSSSANLATLYVDGLPAGSGAAPTFTSRTGTLYLGAASGSSLWYKGEIDEVRFWSVALSQAEIQQYIGAERAADPRMRGYWRLNDNTVNVVSDSSGNGLAGALSGNGADGTPTSMWTSSGEGYSDLAGKQKPYQVGPVQEMEPTLVDPGRLIYQWHDGAGTLDSVWDKVGPLTPATQWAPWDAARGLFQLLVAPQGKITCAGRPATNIFGYALSFDGTTGYMSATATCPAGSMTLTTLARPRSGNAAGNKSLCGYGTAGVPGTRALKIIAGNLPRFVVRNDANVLFAATGAAAQSAGAWAWLTGVLDTAAMTATLYVNGVAAATVAVSGTFATVLSAYTLGAGTGGAEPFDGECDEARVWGVARTAAQVAAGMMAELLGTEAGLAQYWRLNDNSGTAAASAVAGGATGTLNGAATWTSSRYSRADLAWALVTRKASPTAPPLSVAQLNMPAFVAMNALDSADCAYLCEAGKQQTFLDVLDNLINWDGFYGGTRAGFFTLARVDPPVGSSGGNDFDDSTIMGDLVPVAQPVPVGFVVVGYARNWSVTAGKDIIGIVQTQSARYSFATAEWRYAQQVSAKTREHYPSARTLTVLTGLTKLADAQALCARLLAIYSVARDYYEAPLQVVPLSADLGQEFSLTRNRLGLDGKKYFRVVGYKDDADMRRVTARLWA